MTANHLPLDAAARDELSRKAEAARIANDWWFPAKALLRDGFHADSAEFIAACSPDVILALLASVRGAEAERDAWREYAVHLEWCRSCAEDGMDSCHEGKALRDAARAHPPIQETDDA